jgi:hypothetical protein
VFAGDRAVPLRHAAELEEEVTARSLRVVADLALSEEIKILVSVYWEITIFEQNSLIRVLKVNCKTYYPI